MFQVRYLLAGGNRQTDFQIATMMAVPAPDRVVPGHMVHNAFSKRANARAFMAVRREMFPLDGYYIVDLRSEKTKRSYAEGVTTYEVDFRLHTTHSGFPGQWCPDTLPFKTRSAAREYVRRERERQSKFDFRIRKVVTTA